MSSRINATDLIWDFFRQHRREVPQGHAEKPGSEKIFL
jgi:hypothetical protein